MAEDLNQKIEIYKPYVESAQKISEQRCNINNVFMTFNIGLIGLQAFVNIFVLVLFAILTNIIWIVQIKTYKTINKAKFHIINSIEKELPYSPFKDEYDILKNQKNYMCTSSELLIPKILIAFYIIGGILYKFKDFFIEILKEIICSC